ncbi:MAG: Re/Si-specific NAD(P)(+) transhydrogenase subunit alpha [Deltaproteobacteria bacterium]|nr:Re/Si-specific NAD(P)(+) transhydrogenase subunit alpha [Deltaproteobacteria bacterium]
MRIGVPAETVPGERRVALTPEAVGRLVRDGHQVAVQAGAGRVAGFGDDAYRASGADVGEGAAAARQAELVLQVRAPAPAEAEGLAEGALLACFLGPGSPAAEALLPVLVRRRVTALALERVPRISRAQSLDALSSQATLAGYLAVLLGATHMGRILPMLTTAAGTLAPARAFVVGAGVAGLQAIATARRLGAMVSAFDVRPAVKEQVQSLGATFLDVPVQAEGAGGYARELQEEQQRRVAEALARHLPQQDLVITTAQVPGRPAPRLVSAAMVRSMRPGSALVDLAAEGGGNCELTRPGETVEEGGVAVLGPLDLPSRLPWHASQMLARNLQALVQVLVREGKLAFDPADEVAGPMALCHAGEILRR